MMDWEALYQASDTGWDRGGISPALKQWLDCGMINGDDSVLIPGCGRGYEVIEMASRNFNVTAIDIAPSAITALQRGLSESAVSATAMCADIFDYQPTAPFDVVYEQTCLCALQPEQRNDYEQCLFRWLKDDGKLLFSMMQTGEPDGPPFHCDLLDMRQLFHADRWQWPDSEPFVTPRPAGGRFELGFVLHKR